MTCIVAVKIKDKSKSKVVIGCDSLTTLENTKLVNVCNDSKIVQFSNFYVGAAGDGPIIDVLEVIRDTKYTEDEYPWSDHLLNSRQDVTDFVTHFIEKYQERVPEAGNEDIKYEFLLTNGERIWWVINGPSVFEIGTFWSAGSGSSYAIGAMSLLYPEINKSITAEKAVDKAIKIAIKYDINCQDPVEIISP